MTDKKLRSQAVDRPHAPLIYFSDAPAISINNGVVSVTLSADTHIADGKGGVDIEPGVVAYLRTSFVSAVHLRDLFNKVIAMMSAPENEAKN